MEQWINNEYLYASHLSILCDFNLKCNFILLRSSLIKLMEILQSVLLKSILYIISYK